MKATIPRISIGLAFAFALIAMLMTMMMAAPDSSVFAEGDLTDEERIEIVEGIFGGEPHTPDFTIEISSHVLGSPLPPGGPGGVYEDQTRRRGVVDGAFVDSDVDKPIAYAKVQWSEDSVLELSEMIVYRQTLYGDNAGGPITVRYVGDTSPDFIIEEESPDDAEVTFYTFYDWDVRPDRRYRWLVLSDFANNITKWSDIHLSVISGIVNMHGYTLDSGNYLNWRPLDPARHERADIFRYNSSDHAAGMVKIDVTLNEDGSSGIDSTALVDNFYVYEARYIAERPTGHVGDDPVVGRSNQVTLRGLPVGIPDRLEGFAAARIGDGKVTLNWLPTKRYNSQIDYYKITSENIYDGDTPYVRTESITTRLEWLDTYGHPEATTRYRLSGVLFNGRVLEEVELILRRSQVQCSLHPTGTIGEVTGVWSWAGLSLREVPDLGYPTPVWLDDRHEVYSANADTVAFLGAAVDGGTLSVCTDMQAADYTAKRRMVYLHQADQTCGAADADGAFPSCDIIGGDSASPHGGWEDMSYEEFEEVTGYALNSAQTLLAATFPAATKSGLYQYEYEVCTAHGCSPLTHSPFVMIGTSHVPYSEVLK